ncbi:RNA-binding S4 domain-containing protein [Pelagibacterium xiamenense]|uniref:RNA-binding S4 domain-containing protein n=1 Tax=Pelagibacterium xiamenense TaxID=2901140 RepID=UPI001E2C1D88|nr:RNA-binding S4 domain-containing protein [Pelagibacterium xiamenense]MCD7061278.1 RNA-binding S4 domain-containing protein [Pelagibacterium xiamenense]
MTDTTRQRLDKWLWHARVVKSRTLAQRLIESGVVRVNGQRVKDANTRVAIGDGLTFVLHERLRVLKILGIGERRGPARDATLLYEDLSPEAPRRLDVPAWKPSPAPEHDE